MCAYKHIPEADVVAVSDINIKKAEIEKRIVIIKEVRCKR